MLTQELKLTPRTRLPAALSRALSRLDTLALCTVRRMPGGSSWVAAVAHATPPVCSCMPATVF